ncbi:hypothetical protein AB4Y89_21060 [Terriglobus sp. 2YAB30_2]|uniref:hypothetical protein n=1 Tax=unclassified Terriglobus TaxID=2628988 RepID=UPI003F996C50
MNLEWNLHLFRVVIEDGESKEIHVNDVLDWFAITFWSDAVLTRAAERTKSAVLIADNYYRVNAEVVYVSHDPKQAACILDFGIKAISESGGILEVPLPPGCQEGDYVSGEIRLVLPLCTAVHPHNLFHRWRVNRISANLAPFMNHPGDISEVRYQDVSGTDSIQAGSYLLLCSDLNP